jgi:hypothetical protein
MTAFSVIILSFILRISMMEINSLLVDNIPETFSFSLKFAKWVLIINSYSTVLALSLITVVLYRVFARNLNN